MQVAISAEVEAIIERQINSGKFTTPEAAIEASVLYFDGTAASAIEQSRETLRRELRAALEESRRGESRVIEADQFLLEARRLRQTRRSE